MLPDIADIACLYHRITWQLPLHIEIPLFEIAHRSVAVIMLLRLPVTVGAAKRRRCLGQ